jgi:hypothetical protein
MDHRHAARKSREQRLSRRSHPGRSDQGERVVKAHHEALLELRGTQLIGGPAELLGNHDLDVQGAPVRRVEEVVADPFPLKEGIGTVDGALENFGNLLGAQTHPFEPLGSGGESEANGKDALAAPIPLRGLELVENLLPVDLAA